MDFIKINNEWKIFTKRREVNNTILKDVITDITTVKGSNDLKNYKLNKYFEYPKPVILIKLITQISTTKTDIILDFFAGSGTTGDAVMQLNAEDGGDRKYILVQLPEPIDPKKNKTAYDFLKNELGIEKPTIFEITKERLIRAAKKIEEENKNKDLFSEDKELDLGFKVFETIPIWENFNFEADEFNEEITLFDESQLTEDDLKALLTTWKTYDGIPLTQSLENVDLGGYKAYYGNNKLYLIDKGFKTKNLKSLL